MRNIYSTHNTCSIEDLKIIKRAGLKYKRALIRKIAHNTWFLHSWQTVALNRSGFCYYGCTERVIYRITENILDWYKYISIFTNLTVLVVK